MFVFLSGESVTVTVCAQEEDTTALLAKVLDGDQNAASLLAKVIHQDLAISDETAESLQLSISPAEVGIWIDPIGIVFIFCLAFYLANLFTFTFYSFSRLGKKIKIKSIFRRANIS